MQEAKHTLVYSVTAVATVAIITVVVVSFRKLKNFAFREAILLSSSPCSVGHLSGGFCASKFGINALETLFVKLLARAVIVVRFLDLAVNSFPMIDSSAS